MIITGKNNEKVRFWGAALVLLLISCAVLFSNLGGIALLDPDEPVYGQTPKEMIAAGDWLSPRIYGDYWYDKPPMYYWLVAISFKMLGVSEFSARLPATLSALACVMLVFWQMAKVQGVRAGFVSGLILVTSFEFFYVAKGAVTDSTLNLFLTAALLAFWRKKYIWCYVFAGLATVTKGPIGLVFPLGIGVLYLCVTRQWKEFLSPRLYLGLGIYSLIAAPWYVAMYTVHGMAFIETFFGFHNLARFTTPEHPGTNLWYFFPGVFLVGFFPWSILLPGAVYRMVKEGATFGLAKADIRFFQIWAVAILLFFSLSQTKLISYILPMFPPMAILMACYLEEWLLERTWVDHWSWLGLLGVVTGGFSWWLSKGIVELPQLETGAQYLEILLWSMTISMGFLLIRRQKKAVVGMLIVGMILFAVNFVFCMVPAVEGNFGSKNFVMEAQKYERNEKPLYVAKFLRPGYTFHSDAHSLELKTEQAFRHGIHQGEEAYFVVPQSFYEGLSPEEQRLVIVLVTKDEKMLLYKLN